ncbi:MAG TPA: hypothetical protein VF932_09095 [Anaerolineae bacterium]
MDKLSSIRSWITGEYRYDWAQVFGPRGTPYFRYDPSHHIHKQIDKLKLAKNLRMLLLAVWLIVGGLTALLSLSFAGLALIMAILAIAAGVFILIGR